MCNECGAGIAACDDGIDIATACRTGFTLSGTTCTASTGVTCTGSNAN